VDNVEQNIKENNAGTKKLIFAGLSDSGKTSINRMLKNDITGTALAKPTYLVDRSEFTFLDYQIIQHDMGGKKQYLINYLKEPGNYFNNTDVCMYIVNILDKKRFDESVAYFKSMLESFEKIGIHPLISVLFHKAEKYLFEGDEALLATINAMQQKFLHVNAKRFKVAFKITSIYDRWGLSKIFTRIIHELYPRIGMISDLLKAIADATSACAAVLIDDQLLPISEYLDDKAMDRIVKDTAPYLFKIEAGLEELRPTWKRWLKLELDDMDIMYYEIPQAEGKKRMHLYLIGKLGTLSDTVVLPKIAPRLGELLRAIYT
jgi:hypothetical protein